MSGGGTHFRQFYRHVDTKRSNCTVSTIGNDKCNDPGFLVYATCVTISANGIVKWTHIGLSIHTVTSGTSPIPDGKFDSGNLELARRFACNSRPPTHSHTSASPIRS